MNLLEDNITDQPQEISPKTNAHVTPGPGSCHSKGITLYRFASKDEAIQKVSNESNLKENFFPELYQNEP